jgi:hypothetical protein
LERKQKYKIGGDGKRAGVDSRSKVRNTSSHIESISCLSAEITLFFTCVTFHLQLWYISGLGTQSKASGCVTDGVVILFCCATISCSAALVSLFKLDIGIWHGRM